MIKTFTPCEMDAFVTLQDPFGVIPGTIHSKVLDENTEDIGTGTVLVMQKVSVFNPSPRSHYLNITPDNIVRVFPANTPVPIEYQQRLQNRDLNPVPSGMCTGSTQSVTRTSILPSLTQIPQSSPQKLLNSSSGPLNSSNLPSGTRLSLCSSKQTVSEKEKPLISIGKRTHDPVSSFSLPDFLDPLSNSNTNTQQPKEPLVTKKPKLNEIGGSHFTFDVMSPSSSPESSSVRTVELGVNRNDIDSDPVLQGIQDVDHLLEGLDDSFWEYGKV